MAEDRPRVSSFGRRLPDPDQEPDKPTGNTAEIRVDVKPEMSEEDLKALGDAIRYTVYAAARQGLLDAIGDFAALDAGLSDSEETVVVGPVAEDDSVVQGRPD